MQIEAVYENGVFRVLNPEVVEMAEGQRVKLTVEEEPEKPKLSPEETLELLGSVYNGLTEEEIDEIEEIILDRRPFFGERDQP